MNEAGFATGLIFYVFYSNTVVFLLAVTHVIIYISGADGRFSATLLENHHMLISFMDLSLTGKSSSASNLIYIDAVPVEDAEASAAPVASGGAGAGEYGLEGPFPFPEHPEHVHGENESGSTPPVASGDQNIDALLVQSWDTTELTYSFPTSASNYLSPTGGYGPGEEPDTFEALNAGQIAASREIFEMYEAISTLSFTEITETDTVHADYRLAESDSPSTAWGYYPWSDEYAGDSWFNKTSYNTPDLGSFAYHTFIHELGHNSGLKHGHQTGGFGAMTADRDSMEFSIMTYRSYVGHDLGSYNYYTNESGHFAQTLMMYDIAALQHHYGANFDSNSGDTVYTFSTTTGEMLVDGVGVGAPVQNVIFRTIWDGDGVDTYDFSNYATNLSIDLAPGGWSDLDTDGNAQRAHTNMYGDQSMDTHARAHVFNALQYEGDSRSLIENAEGGSGDDVISGNSADNTLYGNGGSDTLYGLEGDDVLFGGTGNDSLFGGADNDTLYGGTGADELNGGDGVDTVSYANAEGAVDLNLATGGTAGDAAGDTYAGIENIVGSQFADFIIGDDNNNVIFAGGNAAPPPLGQGSDIDVMAGPSSFDNIYGMGGDDTLYGATSNDFLYGGTGADRLYGLGGMDTLNGDAGDDMLFGGGDGDILRGGNGADILDGGEGTDTADYAGSGSAVTVNLNAGTGIGGHAEGDSLVSVENITGSAFGDSLFGDDNANRIEGGSGNDVIRGGVGADTLYGNLGSDNIKGGGGGDRLQGGDGNDRMFGEGGSDFIYGGAGDDKLYGNGNDDLIRGGSGADFIIGGFDNDTLYGEAGDDTINGGPGDDQLFGGAGSDMLLGADGSDSLFGGTADDTLRGFSGADRLYGEAGADKLQGGDGDDLIAGGGGRDILFGDAGADIFLYQSASDSGATGATRDIIRDFEGGIDTIDLSGVDADTVAADNQTFTFITGGFSGTAGELRVIDQGGRALVQGDTDGDGNADFAILVFGDAPVEADFVL